MMIECDAYLDALGREQLVTYAALDDCTIEPDHHRTVLY
jgi:hypothetical protein